MARPWFGTAFGPHYPLLYGHRDEAEALRALDLLQSLVPIEGDGPILDLGCGEGRHLGPLVASGHRVVGLDLSAALLDFARQRAHAALGLIRGDMRTLPFSSGQFSSVLSLFTAFGYFGVLADNAPVMAEVARVLVPGGHWFLDYVDCDSVRRELMDHPPSVRTRTMGPLEVRETRRLVDVGQRVEKEVCLTPAAGQEPEALVYGVSGDGLIYTESVALFDRGDLAELAARWGLQQVASAGSYEGVPLGQGTRWILVFQRQEEDGT